MPHTILIVEDHADTRDGLAKLLEISGYAVLAVEDGQQGFQQACAQPPDLILTDIFMPVMDGIEMIRRLRGTPGCRETPILVLSGYGNKALEAVKAGADEVLSKPADPNYLLKAIEYLVDLQRDVRL
jgi:CheY-like chemotaxis protein